MTELMAAAERMVRAVERLERAATQRRGGEKGERQALVVELERVRSERAQLETVTDGVSMRLEAAIDRLRAALGD
jgi:hypothetical protein